MTEANEKEIIQLLTEILDTLQKQGESGSNMIADLLKATGQAGEPIPDPDL